MTQLKQTARAFPRKPEEFAHYQHPDHITILGLLLSNIVPRIQNSMKSRRYWGHQSKSARTSHPPPQHNFRLSCLQQPVT
jgi:hypothetical protein